MTRVSESVPFEQGEPGTLPHFVGIDLEGVGIARGAVVRRAAEITWALSRRLLPRLVRRAVRRNKGLLAEAVGQGLQFAVMDLGVTFVKFGQFLASSPSIGGATLANAMRGVLDEGSPLPFATVRSVVERELGSPLEETFQCFERSPFAAASLAVVHRATKFDGTEVAVKVMRPQSARIIATDMKMALPIARFVARRFPIGVFPSLPFVLEGLALQLAEELDFRNELQAMEWFAEVIRLIDLEGVGVPRAFSELSGSTVLTMEYIEGSKVDDLDAIAHGRIDMRRSIEALIESWFAITLCTGVFHGDLHAGNLILRSSGEVVLLDWGITGRLSEPSQKFFRRSLEGVLGDETAWSDVRDHMMASLGADALATMGISEDDLLNMVRMQTEMIMTSPFRDLDLRALMVVSGDAGGPSEMPTSMRELFKLSRQIRRRYPDGVPDVAAPPHGELLMMKQLAFFERYGKLFLGDRPLVYDTDVYSRLLLISEIGNSADRKAGATAPEVEIEEG